MRELKHSVLKFDLDEVLVELPGGQQLSYRSLSEGMICTASLGSGKSSGPARFFLRKLLKNKRISLFLGVFKSETFHEYLSLIMEAGRMDDLIVLGSGEQVDFRCHTINFLNHEMEKAPSIEAGVINSSQSMIEMAERIDNKPYRVNGDSFWGDGAGQMNRSILEVCYWAKGKLYIDDIADCFKHFPPDKATLEDPEFKANSPFWQIVNAAQENAQAKGEEHRIAHSITSLLNYWPNVPQRTKAGFVQQMLGLIDLLQREPLKSLICAEEPTLDIDKALSEGKIILPSLTLDKWGSGVGRVSQIVPLQIIQYAILRRVVDENTSLHVNFIDEASQFITSSVAEFQSKCRGYLCANIFFLQSPMQLAASMQSQRPEEEGDLLLSQFNTKIMGATLDSKSQEWQSNLIGKRMIPKRSAGLGTQNVATSDNYVNASITWEYQYEFFPYRWAFDLPTGKPGRDGKRRIHMICVSQDKQFENPEVHDDPKDGKRRHWIRLEFDPTS